MATLLIISDDKDFSSVLAEQALLRLKLPSAVADSESFTNQLSNKDIVLIVSVVPIKNPGKLPVIQVQKPIKLNRLLADIAQAMVKPAGDELSIAKNYRLMLRQKQLLHVPSSAAVDLTDKEMQLLETLASAGSRAVAKEQLLKEVWGIDAALDTHTLETHIYRLRGKLRELSGEELIAAIDGGYAIQEK